jgi:hypothetical protein
MNAPFRWLNTGSIVLAAVARLGGAGMRARRGSRRAQVRSPCPFPISTPFPISKAVLADARLAAARSQDAVGRWAPIRCVQRTTPHIRGARPSGQRGHHEKKGTGTHPRPVASSGPRATR